jgi:hypothetical protein
MTLDKTWMDKKVKELIGIMSKNQGRWFGRLSKPLPEDEIRRLIHEVYGRGFQDGASTIAGATR